MILYKHYSFDLWMTLIRSNPSFKTERAIYFYKNYNLRNKTLDEIILRFRQVDLMSNSINEKTGHNISAEEMYLMVISMINDFETIFEDIDIEKLYDEMESLLLNHMPLIYSDDTLSTIDQLKNRSNSTFNISSNTAFIKGSTLRKVLSHLGFEQYFEFQIYSDEIGFSKPNRYFFETMIEETTHIPINKKVSKNEIIHIGDNPVADISGALNAGIKSLQINSNSNTILSLLN